MAAAGKATEARRSCRRFKDFLFQFKIEHGNGLDLPEFPKKNSRG
jgi:hypothetical protein